jgi:hypothetical protein
VYPPSAVSARLPWPKLLSIYAVVHGVWLVLYALLGKGFGYAGFPPFYVSEILLVFALLALAVWGAHTLFRTQLRRRSVNDEPVVRYTGRVEYAAV